MGLIVNDYPAILLQENRHSGEGVRVTGRKIAAKIGGAVAVGREFDHSEHRNLEMPRQTNRLQPICGSQTQLQACVCRDSLCSGFEATLHFTLIPLRV